jgi:hypothetical protein
MVLATAPPSAWCFVLAPLITTAYLSFRLVHHPSGSFRSLRIILGIAILGAGINFLLALLDGKYALALLAVAAGFLIAYFGERLRSSLLKSEAAKEPPKFGLLILEVTISTIWLLGGVLNFIGH